MAETSGFFNSELVGGVDDRAYTPAQFSEYFANFIGNGIFAADATNLQVTNATGVGMSVNLAIGKAYINGDWYKNDAVLPLTISTADATLRRIDLIVLRLTVATRNIIACVKKGTAASSPIAPTLTRDASTYELQLAQVFVGIGVLNILDADITDTRYDSSLCGIVSGLISQISTTNLFAQFTSSFNTWFNAMKGQLTTDAAGNLQTQVNAINVGIAGWKTYALLTDIGSGLLMTSTMFAIGTLMANKSKFLLSFTDAQAAANTDLPSIVGGVLEIERVNYSSTQGRLLYKYTDTNGSVYERVCGVSDTIGTMKAWVRLIDSAYISTWIDISSQIVKNIADITINYALYNSVTKEVKIDISIDTNATAIANGADIITMPLAYRPSSQIILKGCGIAKQTSNLAVVDWLPFYQIMVNTSGIVNNNYTLGVSMYFFKLNFSYVVR